MHFRIAWFRETVVPWFFCNEIKDRLGCFSAKPKIDSLDPSVDPLSTTQTSPRRPVDSRDSSTDLRHVSMLRAELYDRITQEISTQPLAQGTTGSTHQKSHWFCAGPPAPSDPPAKSFPTESESRTVCSQFLGFSIGIRTILPKINLDRKSCRLFSVEKLGATKPRFPCRMGNRSA